VAQYDCGIRIVAHAYDALQWNTNRIRGADAPTSKGPGSIESSRGRDGAHRTQTRSGSGGEVMSAEPWKRDNRDSDKKVEEPAYGVGLAGSRNADRHPRGVARRAILKTRSSTSTALGDRRTASGIKPTTLAGRELMENPTAIAAQYWSRKDVSA
jgi:hypothetical protein